MIEPSFALQVGLRERLIADPAVTAFVDASQVRDGPSTPAGFPSIVLDVGQTVRTDRVLAGTKAARVTVTLHVWTNEAGTVQTRQIVQAVTAALETSPAVQGFVLQRFDVTGARYLRDPKSDETAGYSHAVITAEAEIEGRK